MPDKCEFCEVPESEQKLFICEKCEEKSDEINPSILCLNCGVMKHTRKDHKFENENIKSAELVVAIIDKDNKGRNIVKKTVENVLESNMVKAVVSFAKASPGSVAGGVAGGISAIAEAAAVVTEEGAKATTKQLVKASVQAVGGVAAASGIAFGAICLAEIIYLGVQYSRGTINGREFARLTCKSIVHNTVACGGAIGGFLAGAALGSCLGPAAPVGIIIFGIIGGIIGGGGCGFLTDKIFEKIWPDAEKMKRKEAIKAALKQFFLTEDDMTDPNVFNIDYINKTYRQIAKIVHPDRPAGSKAKFLELGANYGILIALLDVDNEKKKPKLVKAIKNVK